MDTSGNGTRHAVSDINVTPLIDVLLVLLIILMVIVPLTPKGLDALIPQPARDTPAPTPPRTIVVQVLASGQGEPAYKINGVTFAAASLEPKLQEIFSTRGAKVMFVQGDAALDFGKIAEVIDMGHQAQVDHIGLIRPISRQPAYPTRQIRHFR